jgi:hypothetical protein
MKNVLTIIFAGAVLSCNNPAKRNETSSTAAAVVAFAPQNASEQVVFGRAINAGIWGMPAVNFELMYQSLTKAGGQFNQIVYWSDLITPKNQTLTPNPDVIYINPLFDTRQGPVVLEIPPAQGGSSITGSIDDGWQTAIEDVGPAGADAGKGGKYLIIPPGYKGKVPEGYIPRISSTYTGFVILRSNLTDGSKEDIARAVSYGKQVKIYLLSQAANPPETKFVDLIDKPFSNIIPYDLSFFELLNQFVQREPWLLRDMAMIDQLKSIGIEKGKPFAPDARRKEAMAAAIKVTHQYLDDKYEQTFSQPFYSNTRWALPAEGDVVKAIMSNYEVPDIYPVDGRAVSYSMAYFSAKKLGTGQFYLMTVRDEEGKTFDGSGSYVLHLPAGVPVKLYWSVTAYDRQTHALIPDMPHSSRASTTPGLKKNSDGSVDVYFGAQAPKGMESNWVPTSAGHEFELLARFYGPEPAFFQKTWKMPDVKKVK